MQFQRFGDRYQIRLESGEQIIDSLTRLAAAEGIGYATVTGLGAVRQATLAFFNVETREYETHELDEQLEVVSLVGNVSLHEGRPFLHVHASLGRRDLSMVGGHLMEGEAHSTVEVWMQREAAVVSRLPDEESGLTLLQLSSRA